MQVVLAGLELANALVASDASVMETMCLVGIVPTVARFATSAWARGIRMQAAIFVQQLCRTSLATAQMFVACQVCACCWTEGFTTLLLLSLYCDKAASILLFSCICFQVALLLLVQSKRLGIQANSA